MILRPYQSNGVDAIWSALCRPKPVLFVGSTGCGKTEMMIELARRAPVTVAVLMGRDKLVAQTARRMRVVIPETGVWSAGQGERVIDRVNVVSIHSADGLTIPNTRLIIVDECHNLNEGRYTRFLERHPGAKVAGFTATPWRGGTCIYGEGCFFPVINHKIGLKQLIADGYLVPPVARSMPMAWDTSGVTERGGEYVLSELTELVSDRGKITAQVRDAIPRLADRRKIVWTCVSIEHAEAVADRLADAGESVACIHSKSRDADYAMECFEHGPIRHAVSVMMLSEGIDIPAVDAVVLCRPTKSPTLMVQTIGRGLRLSPGKKDCLVLDYGSVLENCGPVDDPYVRVAGKRRVKGDEFKPVLRVCSGCLAYVAFDMAICPHCGHEEKRVVDMLAALTRKAAEIQLLSTSEPEVLQCVGLRATQYLASTGNYCIKLTFRLAGRLTPVHMYGSRHPKAWKAVREIVNRFTEFEFSSWEECWDAVDRFGEYMNVPSSVEVKKDGKYDRILRVYD